MINDKEFLKFEEGFFKPYFEKFIEFKRGKGEKVAHSSMIRLRKLNNSLNSYHEHLISTKMVEELLAPHDGLSELERQYIVSNLRQFCSFAALLGVDVRATLDSYMEQINKMSPNAKVVEEKHESEKAESAPDPRIVAAIEEVELSEPDDDYVVPQEIIDAINEAINEAQAAAEEAPAEEAPEQAADNTGASFTVNVGKVAQNDGKIMLPAYLLKYFN